MVYSEETIWMTKFKSMGFLCLKMNETENTLTFPMLPVQKCGKYQVDRLV